MLLMAADRRAHIIEQHMVTNGISIREMARALKVNHQSVANWLSGENAPRKREVWDKMLAIAQTGAKGSIETNESPENTYIVYRTGIRHVPVGGSAHAGKPDPAYGDVYYIEMVDWGGDFDRWGKPVSGFSMEPELQPDDVIIVENRMAEHTHVVHAVKDGNEVIKILDKHKKRLVSLAEGYDPIDADGWEILGVVIQRRRKGEHGVTDIREYPHGMRFQC